MNRKLYILAILLLLPACGTKQENGSERSIGSRESRVAFVEAAIDGDLDEVKEILKSGLDPDTKEDEYGRIALAEAACKGHLELVKLLLDNGADINAQDERGRTALHLAVLGPQDGTNLVKKQVEIVRLLLARGAELDLKDVEGETPAHIASTRPRMLEILLAHGADFNPPNNDGNTPLHDAAYNGCLDTVKILINAGVDPDLKAQDGATALHKAARLSCTEVAQFLLASGANANAKDNEGHTPLDIALTRSSGMSMAKLLLNHGAVAGRETPKNPSEAVKHGDITKLKDMLASGGDIDAVDGWGRTALHHAADAGDLDLVKFLITKGADIDANECSRTPLILAAEQGHAEVAAFLIKRGANTEARGFVCHADSLTALHRAAAFGHADVVEVLIAGGADINVEEYSSSTPLHLAATAGKKKVVALLLARGAEANPVNCHDKTPLDEAEAEQIRELLLKHGAKSAQAQKGALMDAAGKGDLATVKQLLLETSTVRMKDWRWRTPLHHAVANGHTEVVEFLIAKGADVNARAHGREYPLDVAKTEEMKKLLREHGALAGAEMK